MKFTPNLELTGPLYGKDPWPLRFHSHSFNAACFNTLECSLLYNGHQFGTRRYGYGGEVLDKPSGAPPFENWREKWSGRHGIIPVDGKTFPGAVQIEWISSDGDRHAASIDLDKLFADRVILHLVGRNQVKEEWLKAKSVHPVSPHIMVEVNDRTLNVFMRALVATEEEQIPGNSHSHFRDDLILAWTCTY